MKLPDPVHDGDARRLVTGRPGRRPPRATASTGAGVGGPGRTGGAGHSSRPVPARRPPRSPARTRTAGFQSQRPGYLPPWLDQVRVAIDTAPRSTPSGKSVAPIAVTPFQAKGSLATMELTTCRLPRVRARSMLRLLSGIGLKSRANQARRVDDGAADWRDPVPRRPPPARGLRRATSSAPGDEMMGLTDWWTGRPHGEAAPGVGVVRGRCGTPITWVHRVGDLSFETG